MALVAGPPQRLSACLFIAILGLLFLFCSPVKASVHGNIHDASGLAQGRANARRVEVLVARNATTGVNRTTNVFAGVTASTNLFNPTVLAGFNLSQPCVQALSATFNCSGAVRSPAYLYTWGGLTESDVDSVCTDSCAESFDALRASVASACATDAYTDPVVQDTDFVYGTGASNAIYNAEAISVRPVAFVDYYLLSYKLLCMKDDKTSILCYLESANGTNGTADPCGSCGLGSMRLQLEDARTFDKSLERHYSSSVSSCHVTAAPLTTPASLFLPNNNTLLANLSTTATCTGSYVALPTGESCDDFASAQSVSTDGLLYSNQLAAGCADWPGHLTQLCVQNNCQPYRVQQNDTCLSVAAANNITLTQLVSWNPTIDPLCKNWANQLGHVICLSNPLGYTLPTETIPGAGGAPTPASTAAPVPTDAMVGSNTNCGDWYKVSAGETCALITSKNAISLSDFYFLNPEIDANCTNLWAETSYCIEAVGDITTYPGYYGNNSVPYINPTITLTWASLTTATPATYATPTPTGYPLANGSLSNCFVVFDNSYGNLPCYIVADMFGVDVLDWVLWNPSVLAATGGNYSYDTCFTANETEYCGSFYDQSLVPTTTSGILPAPTDATANATDQCLDWYQTQEGDTCDEICQMADIPYSSLYEWNPALGDNCQNLWLDADYCIAGPGWSTVSYGMTSTSGVPRTTGTSATATATGASGVLTPPAPTQSGAAANCEAWYVAVSGDTCQGIADAHGITLAQLYAWNPAISNGCANLWAQEAYCVLAPGGSAPSTTTTSSVVKTTSGALTPPAPTQSGAAANCEAWYVAASGDTCQAIADAHGITLAQFYAWNPAVANGCANLWAQEAYCVLAPGGSAPVTTTSSAKPTTTAGVTPPGPTQAGIPANCNKYAVVSGGSGCYDFAAANGISLENLYLWNPALNNACDNFWAGEAYCVGVSS